MWGQQQNILLKETVHLEFKTKYFSSHLLIRPDIFGVGYSVLEISAVEVSVFTPVWRNWMELTYFCCSAEGSVQEKEARARDMARVHTI